MDATTQHRVVFDFEVGFGNGGGLRGWDFRLDVEGDDIDDAQLERAIVADLRLLVVDSVRVWNKRIVAEPHRRRAAMDQGKGGSR